MNRYFIAIASAILCIATGTSRCHSQEDYFANDATGKLADVIERVRNNAAEILRRPRMFVVEGVAVRGESRSR